MTSRKDDGGPAFPETRWDDKTRQEVQWSGMSLRDWFAGKATDTDVERWMDIMYANNTPVTREEAKYLYADAMLKARQQ